jgi:hypothetical protein
MHSILTALVVMHPYPQQGQIIEASFLLNYFTSDHLILYSKLWTIIKNYILKKAIEY